jgi:outer membrane protein OmpA-like peptidoglycan-associated protein
MGQQLKPGVAKTLKIAKYAFIALAICGVVYFVKNSSKKVTESQQIGQITMAEGFDNQKATTSNKLALPDFDNPVGSGTPVIFEVMAWNSQFPLMYANGGVRTSKNSLFSQAGIDCQIIRQDDCNQSIKDFVENAEQLANGKTQTPMIVCYMGDGVPGMSSGLNAIKKLSGHRAVAFYPMGRSNGEDCFWGPADWKSHPEHAAGKCVAGVVRDGDMNIVLKWASDNNVRINPNTNTWDSSALNIIPTSDFNADLCSKVINGYSEERDVQVSDGKGGAITKSGEKHTCKVDAYTTWTPADVTIAQKKGGFTRLASTAEYTMQMPNIAIIDAAWAEAHADQMHAFIKALGQAGDQVRSFPEAQEFAAKVSAKVYNEKDANYWLKYFRGSDETDKQGNRVRLGGSQAFNLADAAMMFGLGNESPQVDRYKITYELFGGILTKLYPKEMDGMTPYSDIIDKSYLQFVLENNADMKNGKTEASTTEYASGSTVTEQVSEKAYNISFAIGSANINPSSYPMLNEIYNSAVVSGGLSIFIFGHTDIVGDPNKNQTLSEARANSVADYLKRKGLPANRIQTRGYGSSQPIPGTTADDIRNRCVEIVQGK